MTILIGDVHGKYKQYKRIIANCRSSIQVGDIGIGFRRYPHGEWQANPPYVEMVEGDHRFIRGNHDNPGVCQAHTQWIADGSIEQGVMFCGGGVSIDKEIRIEDFSWWPDEELSVEELEHLIEVYIETKPRVMITHECPEEIAVTLAAITGIPKLDFPSRHRVAFQRMMSAHSPDLWVFGHWHRSLDIMANGTRFVCLAELEAKEFDIWPTG